VPVEESDLLYLQCSKKGWEIPKNNAQDALKDAALEFSFDPVKESLLAIRDDSTIEPADITQLATRYLGIDDELSNRQLAVCAIGAVKRIFFPGCKHDTCLVIHSEGQGRGKSTFWNELATDEFFNDIAQNNDKDFCW